MIVIMILCVIVGVIMMVGIDSQSLRGFVAKQFQISRVLTNMGRMTATTNMAVHAQDLIGFRHDQVQVVGHQQDPTIMDLPDGSD